VFKFKTDLSTRTRIIALKPIVSTNGRETPSDGKN